MFYNKDIVFYLFKNVIVESTILVRSLEAAVARRRGLLGLLDPVDSTSDYKEEKDKTIGSRYCISFTD